MVKKAERPGKPAYWKLMNIGVPSPACEASVGCALTAPLTAGRALVESAANVADECLGFAVERLVACGHAGGCRRREQTYQRKTMARRSVTGCASGGPDAVALALTQNVESAVQLAREAAEKTRKAEQAEQLQYFDLMNMMPAERMLNDDNDFDHFKMSNVIIVKDGPLGK